MASSKTSSTSAGADQKQDAPDFNELGAAAAEAGEQIKEHVTGLTDQVRQQATDQLGSQKERLVDSLDTVALLLRQAGEHADLQDKAMLSGYVDKASGQLTQWSESLREREVSQLLEDTVQFARRQPMIFFSGALAAGFAGARFLRSSTQSVEKEDGNTLTPAPASTATDLPEFASDQAAFESAMTSGDTRPDLDLSTQIDREPEMGNFLEDNELAVLEGDPLIDGSLTGTPHSTSSEQR